MDSTHMKTLKRCITHHSRISESDAKLSRWRLVAILDYANYQSCPMLPFGQPSSNCSRYPYEYKSTKKLHRKEHFQVQDMTNRLFYRQGDTAMSAHTRVVPLLGFVPFLINFVSCFACSSLKCVLACCGMNIVN